MYRVLSKKGKYIQKTMKEVRELEKHNEEYFNEWWCFYENRKIYEMSDYIPVKHIKDPQIFNTFRGYDGWKWVNNWQESAQKAKGNKTPLFGKTMQWWNKYMYHVCGKDYEMVKYVKCVVGKILFNPQNPTKVIIIFQGIESLGESFLTNFIKRLLGGLNIAESATPQQELFGQFNEPLLTPNTNTSANTTTNNNTVVYSRIHQLNLNNYY